MNKPKGFRIEGRIIVDLDDQCKGLSKFYEDLAVPKQLVEFNSDYQKDVSQHIGLIREIINTFVIWTAILYLSPIMKLPQLYN